MRTQMVTNMLCNSRLPWRGVLVPFNGIAGKRTQARRIGILVPGFLTHATNVERAAAALRFGAILLCPP